MNYESKLFSVIVGIPYQTLLNYKMKDQLKRHQVGTLVGLRPILDSSNTKFTISALRCTDIGNEGFSRKEEIAAIQEFVPAGKKVSLIFLTSRILENP